MPMPTNNTLPTAKTPIERALDHFSRDAKKFTTGLAKEIFRKDIAIPLLRMKSIRPYDYFNNHDDNWGNVDALNGLRSVIKNQIIYATPTYIYDCANSSNSTQTFLHCVLKKHSDTLSLSWFLDKVVLPFGLSSFNPTLDPDLMGNNLELACNLLNAYGQFKTAKAVFEHISEEYANWNQTSYEYNQANTVANSNKLFYSAVDFFGSIATGSLAFAFTIGVQRAIHHDNNFIKTSGFLVLSYKVAATSMFIAKIAVEFLIKLPVNMAYDYLNAKGLEIEIISSECNEAQAPQEKYLNQTLSEVTYTSEIEDWSLTKALTVYQSGRLYVQTKLEDGATNIIPVAFIVYLSSHQQQTSNEHLLVKYFAELTLLRLLHETMITDHGGALECPAYNGPELPYEDLVGEAT